VGWRKKALLSLLLLLFLAFLRVDTHHLNPVARSASPYRFSLGVWIAQNLPAKWSYEIRQRLLGQGLSAQERQRRVEEYFRLVGEVQGLKGELIRLKALGSASPGGDAGRGPDAGAALLQARLRQVIRRQERLRPDVEAALEGELAAVAAEQRLGRDLALLHPLFPPVDFRLDALPTVLAVSRRDRIGLRETHLLRSNLSLAEMEKVEQEVFRGASLSALVVDLGGLAAYPAIVSNTQSLRGALHTAAHEWLHQHWFFYPLGWAYRASPEMTTLNETAADIAGRELGDLAFQRLGLRPSPLPAARAGAPGFDFSWEMRQTRLQVDALLADGRVEEAEAYMEVRRRLFVEHGYHLRKLNQAYFAFHGSYAESPASVSPIGGQLHELRRSSPDVGAFVRTVAGFGSYQAFLQHLQRLPPTDGG
jgi:hypothetical protein